MNRDQSETAGAEPANLDSAPAARPGWFDSILGLAIAGAACTALLQGLMAALWAVPLLYLLLLLGQMRRLPSLIHLSLFCMLWVTLPALLSFAQWWPFVLLCPLAAYGLIVLVFPSLRQSMTWFRLGRLHKRDIPAVLAVAAVSAIALVAWVLAADPDLGDLESMVPELSAWMLPLAALGFACVNAALEEAIFRGIMMDALERALGRPYLAIAVQAAAFGAAHYHAGFPRGEWGLAMVFVYGIMLGAIRRRCGGLLAPWAAHVAADLVIFIIMVVITS